MGRFRTPWILRPQPRSHAELRLLCLPYAGGGASAFRAWAEALPQQIDVWAVQMPGRESRLHEAPYMDFRAAIDALTEGVGPLLEPPFALFGHSMGALLAFELARALRRRALPTPAQLVASGCRPPHLAHEDHIGRDLSDDALADLLRRYHGVPQAALEAPGFLDLTLPVIRADFKLFDDYVFTDDRPLPCPVLAMGGEADASAPARSLRLWRGHTTGPFEERVYEGHHFFIHAHREKAAADVGNFLLRHLRPRSLYV